MNLLLKRTQKYTSPFSLIPLKFSNGVVFSLWAHLELTPEEEALIDKYKMANFALSSSDAIVDLKRAYSQGAFVGMIAAGLSLFLFDARNFQTIVTSVAWVPGTWIAITAVMTALYFISEREHISVSQLTGHGRSFKCFSVVQLVQKEASLQRTARYFRQVLESAKHWDDREVIPIEAMNRQMAKQIVASAAPAI